MKFYDKHVRWKAEPYEALKYVISERFINCAMQKCVKKYSQGLRFEKVLIGGTTHNVTLIKIVCAFQTHYSKTPLSCDCEDKKLDFLDNAVSGSTWVRSPIDCLDVDIKYLEDFNASSSNNLQNT